VTDFWSRCATARCVVLPVPTYSQYDETGHVSDRYFVGISYAAMPFSYGAVGPDYYILIEEQQTGFQNLYQTPEDALAAWERKKA